MNEIICGDSRIVLETIPDNSIDLVLTSPPYNFNKEYDQHKDGTSFNDYWEYLFPILGLCLNKLKHGGRMIINIQPHYSFNTPTHHLITKFLLDNGMLWRTEIIWEKNHYNCPTTCWGSFCSPSSPYLRGTWEYLNVYCKGTIKHEGLKENIDITEREFKQWTYAKWSITPESRMKQYGHPAMFPEALVERCLKLFSFRGDVILDPFNGTGTTTKIAKLLDRNFIGIDMSEDYCKTARKRLNENANKLKTFME
jgi:DNA modification methylase